MTGFVFAFPFAGLEGPLDLCEAPFARFLRDLASGPTGVFPAGFAVVSSSESDSEDESEDESLLLLVLLLEPDESDEELEELEDEDEEDEEELESELLLLLLDEEMLSRRFVNVLCSLL